jgi:hypothetical protein
MLSPYSLERVEGYRATAAGKRPKLSLASLIGQAILSSPEQKARLSSIYEWIADRYPEYYQMNQGGWQVSSDFVILHSNSVHDKMLIFHLSQYCSLSILIQRKSL